MIVEGDGDNQITGDRIFGNGGQAIVVPGDTAVEIAASQGGQIEGWLSGGEPDTTYRVDVYASAGYDSNGAGEAEDYLGTLEATTDRGGQAVFDVPFDPPSGLPAITATATDPQGNTSELSAARAVTFQAPEAAIRIAPGQAFVFSGGSDDAIAIQDANAGPLAPVWTLTLAVSAGSLSLSTTAGLTGSGDGRGSLVYSGTATALDAALAGMTFAPPPSYQGEPTLLLDAFSTGAAAIQAQIPIVVTSVLFLVTNTSDSGPGSLRQAILDSNAETGGTNTIDFDIPGIGVQTIAVDSPLPAITNPLQIDGTSQPGYAGSPLIFVVGQGNSNGDALTLGSDVTVRGIAADGYAFANGSASTMLTIESVLLSQVAGGTFNYQIAVSAGEDFLATAQATAGAAASLSLLDAQGNVVSHSDGQSATDPAGVIDTYVAAGIYSLRVQASGGAGTFTLTALMTPSATPFQPIPVGSVPGAIVTGDFNDDGKLDLAVANVLSGSISILMGNGDGTFQPAVNYTVGSDPAGIATGDFAGDGKLDLAVANYGSNSVSILMGNGDGTFQPAVNYPVESQPIAIVAADFDGNGQLDLAVANFGSNTVSILLGNGNGTFRSGAVLPVGSEPDAIVAGEFTDDGKLDLAVANFGGLYIGDPPGSISILLGNGDGTFQPALSNPFDGEPESIAAGDFSGNGILDLAVGSGDFVSILMGNGDGTFQPAVNYSVAAGPPSVVVGDFTGDGILDLAVGSSALGVITILMGSGDGTFPTQSQYASFHERPGLAVPRGRHLREHRSWRL